MILTCGNKEDFAINFQIVRVDEKNNLWGGFEIWVCNLCFGDIWYFDMISANNYSLAEKIFFNEIPNYPFNSIISDDHIIEKIFTGYSEPLYDLSLSRPEILRQSFRQSDFWSKYILLPNDSQVFDQTKLVYFGDDQDVNLIMKVHQNYTAERHSMHSSKLKSVAKEFLDLHKMIAKRLIEIEFSDKSLFH